MSESKNLAVSGIVEIEVQCNGVTPLLFNPIPDHILLDLRIKGGKKPKSAPAPGTPREEAASKVPLLNDGETPHIPIKMLFASLTDAGRHVRLDGKKQVSTAKSTVLPGLMSIHDLYIPIIDPDNPEKTPEWEVDIQGGRNPNGGELVCLIRPRFDRWAFICHIQVFTDEISVDTIRRLFDVAGTRCGIGDFRPNRKGTYGQFRVERWDVVK